MGSLVFQTIWNCRLLSIAIKFVQFLFLFALRCNSAAMRLNFSAILLEYACYGLHRIAFSVQGQNRVTYLLENNFSRLICLYDIHAVRHFNQQLGDKMQKCNDYEYVEEAEEVRGVVQAEPDPLVLIRLVKREEEPNRINRGGNLLLTDFKKKRKKTRFRPRKKTHTHNLTKTKSKENMIEQEKKKVLRYSLFLL